jgi:hypothetical protein
MAAIGNVAVLDAPSFSAFDPSVPITAAKAGVQIETLLSGKRGDIDAVAQLAQLLSRCATKARGGGEKCFFDPASANVLSSAFSAYGNRELRTRDDFDEAISKLARQLTEAASQTNANFDAIRSTLESLRDFCIALSEYSSIKRRSFSSRNQPANPNKKVFR